MFNHFVSFALLHFNFVHISCRVWFIEVLSVILALAMSGVGDQHKDVDPFLIKKWERLFNTFFDTDSSHDVDWTDFYLIVKKVRLIYGAESEQMTYAKKSLTALWDGLLSTVDRNNDKKIQLDEWIDVLKKTDPKTQPKWFTEYMTYMFKLFDVSADGVLDLAEYADGMVAYGFDEDDARTAFKKFAVDKAGKPVPTIDFTTFKKYWQEYFYSTDQACLGNYLFGIPN